MSKICVLIRVYNRVEDLKYCIDIIRNTWKSSQYYIIVVFNGRDDGYIIDNDSSNKIDSLIEIKNNIGHFSGNSQLLLAALNHIPNECDYTVILEADTWLYGDNLITKYIKKLEETKAVWASAQFFRYISNLATDFAIVKTSFIKTNQEVFTFNITPEYHVANYLIKNNFKYLYITENMPISMPRYVKKYPYAPTGRFFSFEKSKMVTHHIESLIGGMEEKKFYFNAVAGLKYFDVHNNRSYKLTIAKMRFFKMISYLLPYKSWLINEKNNYN